jgi:hypothetical protein
VLAIEDEHRNASPTIGIVGDAHVGCLFRLAVAPGYPHIATNTPQ